MRTVGLMFRNNNKINRKMYFRIFRMASDFRRNPFHIHKTCSIQYTGRAHKYGVRGGANIMPLPVPKAIHRTLWTFPLCGPRITQKTWFIHKKWSAQKCCHQNEASHFKLPQLPFHTLQAQSPWTYQNLFSFFANIVGKTLCHQP